MLKKKLLRTKWEYKEYKECPLFFFRELQFITVLLLICDSCMGEEQGSSL